jgi:hypothetical protein
MSAKGKLGAKILSELGDTAFRWVSSLADKLGRPADEVAEEMGSKLINLEKEMPEAFGLFDRMELFSAVREANERTSELAIASPPNFRKIAAQLDMENPAVADEVNKTVQEYIGDVQKGTAMGDVPYLSYETPGKNILGDTITQFVMHDGRHRNRAMEALGALRNLVRVIPKGGEKLASKLPDDAKAYTEMSNLQIPGEEGKEVGKMRDLFKYLSAMGIPLGALGGMTDDEQNGI